MLPLPFAAFFAVAAAAASTVTTATGPAQTLRLARLVVRICQLRPGTPRESHRQINPNPSKSPKPNTKIK